MLYKANRKGKTAYASNTKNLAVLDESRHEASGEGKDGIFVISLIYILANKCYIVNVYPNESNEVIYGKSN
jgi:hypothetical protein